MKTIQFMGEELRIKSPQSLSPHLPVISGTYDSRTEQTNSPGSDCGSAGGGRGSAAGGLEGLSLSQLLVTAASILDAGSYGVGSDARLAAELRTRARSLRVEADAVNDPSVCTSDAASFVALVRTSVLRRIGEVR